MQPTNPTCFRCGDSRLIQGTLPNTSFVPNSKPRRILAVWPAVEAVACIGCGHVELQVDPEDLIANLGEPSSNKV